jgi:hypothetical protein
MYKNIIIDIIFNKITKPIGINTSLLNSLLILIKEKFYLF